MTVVIDPAFNPIPSLDEQPVVQLGQPEPAAAAHACFVNDSGDLPQALSDFDRAQLCATGFSGARGQTLRLPGQTLRVLVGAGEGISSTDQLRDAAAAFARAANESAALAIALPAALLTKLGAAEAALAATEGAILARYRYDALRSEPTTVPLETLHLAVPAEQLPAAQIGVNRALVLTRSAMIARDVANTPPRHLSAEKFATLISELAPRFGLSAEIFDRQALIALGCGGLLGVNAGSTEEPRMIKLSYHPQGTPLSEASAHLALVGKGIMYDSGGISLKPSNAMHAAMKLDMMGAAAVFAAMTALHELQVPTHVTGWLMCTDNMPSGSATKLGDVLTIRGGKTVEVKNTDAEGRLVLADGLQLATEESRRPDAIVDIATLTGAAMMALGTRTAVMLANHDQVAAQLERAAEVTAENIWRFPLDHGYREQLKSQVADLSNIGGQYAGAILAALFLNEFVDGLPWGHLDIAGTMQAESDDLWRTAGSTGFGARLLAEFAAGFSAPDPAAVDNAA